MRADLAEDRAERVRFRLENVCPRVQVQVERLRLYLERNGYRTAAEVETAPTLLFFGCAFNRHNHAHGADRQRYRPVVSARQPTRKMR